MKDYAAHPLADIFPMLMPAELKELADDIKAKGLVHPIVLFGDLIIDGRNRYAACKLAGVTPIFKEFTGKEEGIAEYIISENIQRREMTPAQKAMAVAKLRPVGEKGGRGKKAETRQNSDGFSTDSLARARFVLANDPILADAVLRGTRSLNDVYTELKRKADDEADEATKMARLEAVAPDIARLVVEGEMTVTAGFDAYNKRLKDAEVQRAGYWATLRALGQMLTLFADPDADGKVGAENYIETWNGWREKEANGIDLPKMLDLYIDVFTHMRKEIEDGDQ